MISLDYEIEIEAPIEYVLEWVSNSESRRRSNPAGLDVESSMMPTRCSGSGRRSLTFGKRSEVTDSHDRYANLEVSFLPISVYADEDVSGEITLSLSETEAGTHVRLHGDIETGTSLLHRALRPVVTRNMNRQYRNSLMTMKELVEVEYATREPEPVES
jgi:hypothetical protein